LWRIINLKGQYLPFKFRAFLALESVLRTKAFTKRTFRGKLKDLDSSYHAPGFMQLIDWLIVWGVTQAAGPLVFSVMQELAIEGAKDYGKEFFKNSLGKAD
jgi:hypothetical protein